MSQQEIVDWLAANPGWHRTADVSKGVGKQSSTVRCSLKRLSKYGEVEMIMLKKPKEMWWRLA
ncbi:MAG: hypothetical protein A4E48_00252 [Methanosaeta sp. PtaU1.Bin060]|nr:MAG: hypothetical protein A4E48_00252 [Methanosaeta sp. PtaU1.Bin060]